MAEGTPSTSSAALNTTVPASVKRSSEHSFKLVCPQCRDPHPNIVEDFAAGDLICGSCGVVIGDRIIDTRSEWRSFTNDGAGGDDPSRVGGPSNPLLDSDQLDTMISGRDNYTGVSKDLNRLQSRTNYNSAERTLMQSFKDIANLCEHISLPRTVADRAKQLFKLAHDNRILKGKGNEEVVATCIYVACRQEKVTRGFKEISSLTRVPKKDIGRCFKLLSPLLEKKMSTVTTEDFMTRFCSYLSLPIDVQKAAIHLAKECNELGCTAGKSPITVAAAGIYIITSLFPKHKKALKDISFVSAVSESTIRSAYKDMLPFREQLVPKELHPHFPNLPPV